MRPFSKCRPFNSKAAMQKAKRTVEEEYAVVGTWEDTNITLSVLEHYIPKFFRNAKTVYYGMFWNIPSFSKPDIKTNFRFSLLISYLQRAKIVYRALIKTMLPVPLAKRLAWFYPEILHMKLNFMNSANSVCICNIMPLMRVNLWIMMIMS